MPIPYLLDAFRRLSGKSPLGSALTSREWEDVPLAIRERAQFSARVESARLLQSIQERVQGEVANQREALANGKQAFFDRSAFIDAIRSEAEALGIETIEDENQRGTVRDIRSIRRLGLIHDMQVAQAGGFARWKMDTTEGALLVFPAQRLTESTAEKPRGDEYWFGEWQRAGSEVGWEGAMQSDFVALKTSPIWAALSRFGTPWPPFDFGSTRELEDVSFDDAVTLGLIADDWQPPAEPQQGFNDGLEASLEVSPEMEAQLRKAFGGQVVIEGGKVRLP